MIIKRQSIILTGGFTLLLASATVSAIAAETPSVETKHWITQAPSQIVKDKRIEQYLRGFDQPMWEVGERYQHLEQAIIDSNFELASYHWNKIKTTIENGLMKRPARRKNAEAILLNHTWGEVSKAFASKDISQAKLAVVKAKAACMACHSAENVAFINNQPLFTQNSDNG